MNSSLQPDIVEVHLPFTNAALSLGTIRGEVAVAFISYILYTRGILHEPHELLSTKLRPTNLQGRLSNVDRIEEKLYLQLTSMLSGVQTCFEKYSVIRLCILIGPSINNPKEVFTLQYCGVNYFEEIENTEGIAKKISLAKRRLVQKLIEFYSNQSLDSLSRTNAFFAINLACGVESLDSIPDHDGLFDN